ncbi:NlpC/P60 family protein [Oscillospiraceae bacterium OttesenSCG-928-F05]|nr:NlpC/P60 family protein [Oscillospiraceae bacterium OttesenSCG-928-F05]
MRKIAFLTKVCVFTCFFGALFILNAGAVKLGTVTADALNIRAAAEPEAQIVTTAAKGTTLLLTNEKDGWYTVWIDGTSAFAVTEYIEATATAEYDFGTGRVNASVLNIRSEPSTSAKVLCKVSFGTSLQLIGVKDSWFMVKHGNYTGYVHPEYITLGDATYAETGELRSDVINYAKQFIGTPYRAGGAAPGGFDCSGFVYYVFNHFGYSFGRGASTMMDNVPAIARADLLPGDLVFFNNGSARRASHVGIYVGDDQFIHATSPGNPLTISTMATGYYAKYYVGSGRVLD